MREEPVAQASILLSGWACRTHTVSDGRRQIVGVMLGAIFAMPLAVQVDRRPARVTSRR